MQRCLIKIADLFNRNEVIWALGASMLLHYKGLIAKPNDIDLVVSLKDAEKADGLLCGEGLRHPPYSDDVHYSTKYFHEYLIDGREVDLMAGFAINHPGGAYEYKLDPAALESFFVEDTEIPLCPMEDWFVIYMLMPGRENRVKSVEGYLKENRCNLARLQFWLGEDIPDPAMSRIESFIAQYRGP